MHVCDPQVAVVGELIKEGKVKYWGLSNETTYGKACAPSSMRRSSHHALSPELKKPVQHST